MEEDGTADVKEDRSSDGADGEENAGPLPVTEEKTGIVSETDERESGSVEDIDAEEDKIGRAHV